MNRHEAAGSIQPFEPRRRKQWPRHHPTKTQIFDHRTKMERLATILLPNSVAAHDMKRDVMDGSAKIFKENRTVQNEPSLAGTAVTDFRVRCIQPLCHLSGGA
jgi:hypothetical protein